MAANTLSWIGLMRPTRLVNSDPCSPKVSLWNFLIFAGDDALFLGGAFGGAH